MLKGRTGLGSYGGHAVLMGNTPWLYTAHHGTRTAANRGDDPLEKYYTMKVRGSCAASFHASTMRWVCMSMLLQGASGMVKPELPNHSAQSCSLISIALADRCQRM